MTTEIESLREEAAEMDAKAETVRTLIDHVETATLAGLANMLGAVGATSVGFKFWRADDWSCSFFPEGDIGERYVEGEGATIADAVRDALWICVRRYERRAIDLRVLADEMEEEAAE